MCGESFPLLLALYQFYRSTSELEFKIWHLLEKASTQGQSWRQHAYYCVKGATMGPKPQSSSMVYIAFVKILSVVTHVIKGPWFAAWGVAIIMIITNNSMKLFSRINQFDVKSQSKFSKWKMLIQGNVFPFVVYFQVLYFRKTVTSVSNSRCLNRLIVLFEKLNRSGYEYSERTHSLLC